MRNSGLLLGLLGAVLVPSMAWSQPDASGRSPFHGAIASWQMNDLKDSSGRRPLVVQGAVALGVALEGADREASLARGGDGRAARFDGGYLAIAPGDGVLNVPGQAMTVALRLRNPEGKWDGPIFGSYGAKANASYYLHAVDGRKMPMSDRTLFGGEVPTIYAWMFGSENGPRSIRDNKALLEFIWGAAESDAPRLNTMRSVAAKTPAVEQSPLYDDVTHALMRVCFPIRGIGPTVWHDVVVRFTGPKLQLFIDGVLVDEEFPLGRTRQNQVPCLIGAGWEDGRIKTGFRGLIDHVAVWDRALSDTEIVRLCGGQEQVSLRDQEILGAVPAQMQYYRARGHNSKAGDCIPFFHDGTFHLFYLILRRNMHSKWDGGHGGLEIHHASTKDLRTWTHHPVTAPISEQWEAWNGTGGVVWGEGAMHWFYPTPCYNPQWPFGGIQLATSRDGERFVKQSPHPFLPGGDCEVFADPDPQEKLFHLVKEGRLIGNGLPALQDKTLVAWVSPADLDQHGGSVLTVEGPGAQFDALVYGERMPRRWMAGSEMHRRTQADQHASPGETAAPGRQVQIAAVYSGRDVTLYRNGERYAHYTVREPLSFPAGARVILGLRHVEVRGQPHSYFHGSIADARIYAQALTAAQVRNLRAHEPAGPKPLVWFDFGAATAADRAGTLAPGTLEGGAAVVDGQLVLNGSDGCLLAGGRKMTLAHLVSEDLRHWRELPEPILVADAEIVPQMCPHWFRWNDWYYFIGGVDGIWKSRQPFGPWSLQSPRRLDNLSVPKTAAFRGNRRIFAGFLGDGGWGGNLVLRDLVQLPDGSLASRFSPEMILRSGKAIAAVCQPISPTDAVKIVGRSVSLAANEKPAWAVIRGVPQNVRITLTVSPEPGVRGFCLGLRGRAAPEQSCRLQFAPASKTAGFSASTDSGGGRTGAWMLDGSLPLDRPFAVDIVCRHDILDAEIGGRRTLVNRYWDPEGDCLYLGAEQGAVSFSDIVIRPLEE